MLRIKIYNVVLLLTILMCIHVHIRLTISVTPGKRMNNIAFRQLKLHQAKTTYDLVHAAANEKKTLRRNLMPGHAYRWYDREHNWDRVRSLIDWAEGRPPAPTYKQLKKQIARSTAKGDTLSLLQEGKMSPSDILSNWRLKKQLKIMEQEKVKKNSKHFNNNIAHVQYAIKQSKMENSDSKAAETAKHIAGKLNMFKVTKNVASQIKTLSTALASKSVVSNKNNNKVTHPNSFIELSEKSNHPKSFKLLNKKKDSNFRFLEGKRSMKSRKGSIGDQIKAGAHKGWEKAKAEGKKKLNEVWTKAKCKMAKKLPFGLDREMAKKHCPPEKKKTPGTKPEDKPGTPKPPPPTKPSVPGGTPPNNAATDEMCVMCVYVMERLERDIGFPGKDLTGSNEGYSSNGDGTYPGPASYDISNSGLGNNAANALPINSPLPGPGFSSGMFLETKEKVTNPVEASEDFKDYETLIPNKQNLEQRLKNDYNMEPRERALRASETTLLENERRTLASKGIQNVRFIDTSKAPRDQIGTGKPLQDTVQLTAYSMDNTKTMKNLPQGNNFLETSEEKGFPSVSGALSSAANAAGSVASAAAGVAGAVAGHAMSNIHCPDGMPYCRKPLKRLGRRGLIREQDRNNKQLQFANTYTEMGKACKSMLKEFPAKYTKYVQNIQQNLPQVAKEYLHDYSNEEICVDVGMCVQKQVRVQATKIDYRL